MQVKNVIAIFQLKKFETENKRQKDEYKLFVKLYKPNNVPSALKLHDSELFEDESFKDNTQKEIWKLFNTESFEYIKGKFYDIYETKIGERLVQCSNICFLKEEIPTDEFWYKITFNKDQISMTNGCNHFHTKYKIVNDTVSIISCGNLLLENHSEILIDILLQLRNIFSYSDIALDFLPEEFTVSDIATVLNAFCDKAFSKATIRRRFADYIEKTDKEETGNQFRPSTIYKRIQA